MGAARGAECALQRHQSKRKHFRRVGLRTRVRLVATSLLVDPHPGALVPRGRRIQRDAPTAADPEKKIKVALKWGFELASASIRQLSHKNHVHFALCKKLAELRFSLRTHHHA